MHPIQPGVSLICATKNRHAELRRLFTSLQVQTSQQFELIIVDQNESPLIVDLVQEFRNHITIKHLRFSFASNTKARNEGVRHASFSWVGFPDDDCWYPEDAIAKLLDRIKRENSDAIFINWSDPVSAVSKTMFSFDRGIMKLDEAFVLASCICIFFNTETFRSAKGFNEKMGLGSDTLVKAGEEQDLMLNVISKGGKIYKDPTITVYHPINQRPWDESFRERIKSQGACDIYFTRKYKGWVQALKLQLFWCGATLFNLIRGSKKNAEWYFYKVLGSIMLASKL